MKHVRTSDKIEPRDVRLVRDKLITVYGNVELTENERKFLSLGPDFPLMETLDKK